MHGSVSIRRSSHQGNRREGLRQKIPLHHQFADLRLKLRDQLLVPPHALNRTWTERRLQPLQRRALPLADHTRVQLVSVPLLPWLG